MVKRSGRSGAWAHCELSDGPRREIVASAIASRWTASDAEASDLRAAALESPDRAVRLTMALDETWKSQPWQSG
jgi:hypothetical protein